jgi:diadenosine tetraphosphate (Ap4A) HIT family hydrolase
MIKPDCPLCQSADQNVLWQHPQLRVIDARDPMYPGFTRVIWQDHVQEMTDLQPADQQLLMQVVLLVESLQRTMLRPDKINLAAFGNMVPHLHWHIIPRWSDDPHFPQPVWANLPEVDATTQDRQALRRTGILAQLNGYHAALVRQLNATFHP